jgi:uncharacterized protein
MKILIIILLIAAAVAGTAKAQTYADSIAAFREDYKAGFLTEERSPLKKDDLRHLSFFPADEKYRVSAEFLRDTTAQPFDMMTYSGKTKPYIKYGTFHFTIEGKELQLSVYRSITLMKQEAYAHHLFLPFKDVTNGAETYGGGRYIDMNDTDITGNKTVLDFNKAYNPWCAYSTGYSCPIPPDENHLPLPVQAGEKIYLNH